MKPDAYTLLGLPRRAALTAEEVRAAFQQKGAASHPDHADTADGRPLATENFAAINEAAITLSSPSRRLRHLLFLEYPEAETAARTGAAMDGAMMQLFSLTAAAVQQASAVQEKKQNASSALLKALLAEQEMQAQETLETAAREVDAAIEGLSAELISLDTSRAEGARIAASLQSCAARAGFLEKWQAQLRAAFAGLFAS